MSEFAASVIIPLFNKAPFVRDMLESVLNQTYPVAEIIIVDDSSTDGGVAAIDDLIGGPVRLIRQANAGPGVARNRGVADATSEWIAFIDADDQWQPNHLATLEEVAAAFPRADLVASGFRRISTAHQRPPQDDGKLDAHPLDYFGDNGEDMTIFTSSLATRKSALAAAGGFGASFPGEDIDLWLRIALTGEIAATARVTSFYIQHTGGVMDTLDATVKEQPIDSTIAAALADPRHTARHPGLRAIRNRYWINGIKQHLYRGERDQARAQIRACDRVRAPVSPLYRLMSLCPSPLLSAALRMRSGLRK